MCAPKACRAVFTFMEFYGHAQIYIDDSCITILCNFFSRRGKLLKGLTEEGINCGGCGEKTVRLRPGKGTFLNDVTHLVGIAVL